MQSVVCIGPEVIEPLELLVLDHVDPAGQHAVIRDTTRLLERPLARPESSLSDGLVERISDGEPAARQVPDTTLDSRPMDGITYLDHLAPGCPWTVDTWRGCRVWNHWSSRFFIHCGYTTEGMCYRGRISLGAGVKSGY